MRGGSWGSGFQPPVWRDGRFLLTPSGTEQDQAESSGPRGQTSPTRPPAEPPSLLPSSLSLQARTASEIAVGLRVPGARLKISQVGWWQAPRERRKPPDTEALR